MGSNLKRTVSVDLPICNLGKYQHTALMPGIIIPLIFKVNKPGIYDCPDRLCGIFLITIADFL